MCLLPAFTFSDPKSAKKLLNLTVFLVFLGSVGVKAALKILVKLTPSLHTREISPTKAQQRQSTQAAFCAFGIIKALHKHVDEIDP